MCKCCQNCLESIWWHCCEEKYCWDDSIVYYEDDWKEKGEGGIVNGGAIFDDAVITRQPDNMQNNNHLRDQMYASPRRDVLQELPILAPNLYQVFSKSMIFKDDSKDPPNFDEDNKRTDGIAKKKNVHSVSKTVTFSDNSPKAGEQTEEKHISDFQIMFQDELYGDHKIFNIEEEEEDDQEQIKIIKSLDSEKTFVDAEEIVLRRDLKTPVKTPVEVFIQEPTPEKSKETKDQTLDSPSKIVNDLRKKLPRARSALILQRSDSSKSLLRNNSRQDLLRRVESMKENESENIKKVLARLPETTVPFLAVSDLLDDKDKKDQDASAGSSASDQTSVRNSLISQMPDTPVIKGSKLPKFFAETPTIGEYKPEISLQSLKTSDVISSEFDFSMPRYYNRYANPLRTPEPLHTSKSMPDLNVAMNSGKVNKRLVKLRSRLKPLIIKKSDSDLTKSQNEPHKY